jgi:hypothetical protein
MALGKNQKIVNYGGTKKNDLILVNHGEHN